MLKEKKILIVEDECIASEFLTEILKDLGIEDITVLENGAESIEFCEKSSVDLIFMDINIDGNIDGIQCAKTINQNRDIPIVFTSAYSDDTTIDEASDVNIYGYLVKPFKKRDVSIALKVIEKRLFTVESDKSTDKIEVSKECIYDTLQKSLIINSKQISLNKKEALIVELLIKRSGEKVSYEDFKNSVWKKDVSDSAIRDAFLRLRKKAPELNIINYYGFGYSLELSSN